MNKQEFTERAVIAIRTHFPEKEIDIVSINKPKGKLTGIQIKEKNADIAPVFYIEDAYEAYLGGVTSEQLIDDLISAIKNTEIPKGIPVLKDFDKASSRITMRLVNKVKCENFIENVPNVEVAEGIVMTFAIYVGENHDGGYYSAPITNDVAVKMDMTVSEYYNRALESADKYEKPKLCFLEESILANNAKNLLEENSFSANAPLCLTTVNGVYGASALFYKGMLERLSSIVGGNYYVIPSSIHEVIIIPESLIEDTNCLIEMLQMGNMNLCSSNEVLSDIPFYYSHGSKTLSPVIKDTGLREEMLS